jgi:hypothetical protein
MGVTVGPAVFVERFVNVGIKIDGGHETLVHETWLVEKYWSNLGPPPAPNSPNPGGPWLAPCSSSFSSPSNQQQQWVYTSADADPRNVLSHSVESRATGQCMDMDGCQAPVTGAGLLMWPCANTTAGSDCNGTNQQWLLDPKTSQLVTAMDATLCLSAPSMRLAACDVSMPAQQWRYNKQNGTVTNALIGPNHCLSTAPVPPAPPAPPGPTLNNHSVAVQINGAPSIHPVEGCPPTMVRHPSTSLSVVPPLPCFL